MIPIARQDGQQGLHVSGQNVQPQQPAYTGHYHQRRREYSLDEHIFVCGKFNDCLRYITVLQNYMGANIPIPYEVLLSAMQAFSEITLVEVTFVRETGVNCDAEHNESVREIRHHFQRHWPAVEQWFRWLFANDVDGNFSQPESPEAQMLWDAWGTPAWVVVMQSDYSLATSQRPYTAVSAPSFHLVIEEMVSERPDLMPENRDIMTWYMRVWFDARLRIM
ncbi:hypothetical protein C8034_v002297 [Colletotrichum sidae]|uniref:Uncharacterized protein n=1 Tax=Colletotrichum sidae TaxID=1347389 RepID=A0A4R8TD60_9PEZI|nr:hypothetical protein C8034_v002297 [Colletotrichum sidae]